MRLTKFVLFLLALAVIFGGLIYSLEGKPPESRVQQLEKPMPTFSLEALQPQGSQINEKVFLNNGYQLLNVWASWCAACKYEHPFLLSLKKQGVHIVGLNYRDKRADAVKVLANDGNPYHAVIHDLHGQLALDLGVVGAPETYLVDSKGRLVMRYSGILDEASWKRHFVPLMMEQ